MWGVRELVIVFIWNQHNIAQQDFLEQEQKVNSQYPNIWSSQNFGAIYPHNILYLHLIFVTFDHHRSLNNELLGLQLSHLN